VSYKIKTGGGLLALFSIHQINWANYRSGFAIIIIIIITSRVGLTREDGKLPDKAAISRCSREQEESQWHGMSQFQIPVADPRIEFGRGTWRARGARAYKLYAEPPAGSRGRAPGQGVMGRSPPEAEAFELSNVQWKRQKCLVFSTL